MSKILLPHAKISPRRSASRGHADHDWLHTYHTFSFSNYYDPSHTSFGSLRVLNEDRVDAHSGFPTHPHRDAEIFSYILSGELTHRDSMVKPSSTTAGATSTTDGKRDDFYRMKRGDVQFTTGGRGIAHSEQNESDEQVHFLQIWATPWTKGLTPRYHTRTFDEAEKRKGFVNVLSPLLAGKGATEAQEKEAKPAIAGTIPIHADLVMGAGIVPVDKRFKWVVGGGGGNSADEENNNITNGEETNGAAVVKKEKGRHVYLHVPMCKQGHAKVRLAGREDVVLNEGDGAYIDGVNAGDVLSVESIGEAEAEVVVLDSD
ncbi:hypothetical protein MMC09_002160 [Bachmanniomyces sp. S44760]|nr:hypothetical protein [Bachmanniomyces sp. S44760]